MKYGKEKLESMYNAYENVRVSGMYNMFSSEAMMSTGLIKDEYLFVMENYSELKELFGGK